MTRSVAEVFAIADDQATTFTKAVSIGLLVGSAMSIASRRCASKGIDAIISGQADIGGEIRRILIENRDKQFLGLSTPVTDEEIEAMLEIITMDGGRMFFSNVTVR